MKWVYFLNFWVPLTKETDKWIKFRHALQTTHLLHNVVTITGDKMNGVALITTLYYQNSNMPGNEEWHLDYTKNVWSTITGKMLYRKKTKAVIIPEHTHTVSHMMNVLSVKTEYRELDCEMFGLCAACLWALFNLQRFFAFSHHFLSSNWKT